MRLIVPFPPGGQTDIVGRIISQWLSERLGQQVIVGTSASPLPTRSLAAANPARSGTVSRSQTMTLGFMQWRTAWECSDRDQLSLAAIKAIEH